MDTQTIATILGIVLGLAAVGGYMLQIGGLKSRIEDEASKVEVSTLLQKHDALAGEVRPRVATLESKQQATEILTSGHGSEIKHMGEMLDKIDSKLDRLLNRNRNQSSVDG